LGDGYKSQEDRETVMEVLVRDDDPAPPDRMARSAKMMLSMVSLACSHVEAFTAYDSNDQSILVETYTLLEP
jgi:hypothetical protein